LLLADTSRLDDLLVTLLGTHGPKSANWLLSMVQKRFRICSIQGVYQELRKLQTSGIVVKVGKEYHLSITWSAKLLHFSDSVGERFISRASTNILLPSAGSSYRWQFSSLLRADDLWVQAYQMMFIETGAEKVFSYIHEPWYYFAQPKKVAEYYRFVTHNRKRLYYVFQSDNFLTREYLGTVPKGILEHSFAKLTLPFPRAVSLSTIGPYLFTLSLDAVTLRKIASIFESVKRRADIDLAAIAELLQAPARITVTIHHNAKKAARVQRIFADFFGVEIS
jgi:hypothetical protein